MNRCVAVQSPNIPNLLPCHSVGITVQQNVFTSELIIAKIRNCIRTLVMHVQLISTTPVPTVVALGPIITKGSFYAAKPVPLSLMEGALR